MKKVITTYIVLGMLTVAGPVWAIPSFGLATLIPTGKTLTLPTTADVSPAIVWLGTATDPQSDKVVEGYAFIHYKKDEPTHKPGHTVGSLSTADTCYSYLAKGAKWKGTPEPWIMNSSNTRSLSEATVFGLESAALRKWEDAAASSPTDGIGVPIFGAGTSTTTRLTADTIAPDGGNEIYFGDIASPGAIAVTIVWGIFSGPTFQRQLVEWDQVYDQVDFDWSTGATSTSKMDFDNIASHEDCHATGMGHPSDSCTEETMYRFAGFGETKKRGLNTGDIVGINKLY